MVMLRPQSSVSNIPGLPGRAGAEGGRIADGLQTVFGVSMRCVPALGLRQLHWRPRAHAAAPHGHSADDRSATPPPHPGPTPRGAEIRFAPIPPREPTGHAPPTNRGRRLNLLLSWGGWQNESWADLLPALLEPMGVHSLRVRTAREAERAIRTNPVHIAVVDLGLPLDAVAFAPAPAEEAGLRVLELLRRLDSTPPTVVVQQARSERDAKRHMSAALRCDAFAVVDRTAVDVELMLKIMQRCMQRYYHDRWPGSP